ncbi:MAG: RsmB/NOP family class I SAM-dependent RNA methyltransferase [Pseudomonadota bacterium]
MKDQQGLMAREAGVWLLQAVLRRNLGLDEALAAAFSEAPFNKLSPRDRAFARTIAATTLRRMGQIDAVLRHFQARRLPPRSGPAQNILRTAAAQILLLGTASHAAVSNAVELADKDKDARHFKGMINAVLRKVASTGKAMLLDQDAARLNTPEWLWESWRIAYDNDTARAIATAHLKEPPLDITPRGDAAALAESLEAQLLPTGSLRRETGGRIEDLPGFTDGEWWVQDTAASLPARLFGDVTGKQVIDLCAAPGGKTLQLAAGGAIVTAIDRSDTRLRRVQENLARLKLTATCITADATLWRPPAPVSYVLLDAPCSATGTIRRHPDIAWRKTQQQIGGLMALQDRLLAAAANMLAPGGMLIFCTCSLQPEEGPERIEAFLAKGAPFVRVPVRAHEVGGMGELITALGELRTLPSHLGELGGMDGFYAARLQRV